MNAAAATDGVKFHWRAVRARGRFFGPNILLDNRMRAARVGYDVFTSFQLDSGTTLLVARGWIPATDDRALLPSISVPKGHRGITGHAGPAPWSGIKLSHAENVEQLSVHLVRIQRISFVLLNRIVGRDLSSFVVYLDPRVSNGYDRTWSVPTSGAGKHTAYAVQWFAMAAVLLGLYLKINWHTTTRLARSMTEQTTPSRRRRNRMLLLVIVAVFVGPIVIARLYVMGVFDWRSHGMVNRGTLITPPIDIANLGDHPSLHKLALLAPGDWAIVLIEPGSCEHRCLSTLNTMLVLRELLGQGAVRVSVHAITSRAQNLGRHASRIHLDPAGAEALAAAFASDSLTRALPALALVDWRHQLMMYYPVNTPPQDLQKDLKRLLRASEIH
ncbi:MAG: SURF1 family protein [Gammaproteobacteria bacterium]|nr:SURF1 family protein [Gammaproteobacteria bacterium]